MTSTPHKILVAMGKHTINPMGFTAYAFFYLLRGQIDFREFLRHLYRFIYGVFPIVLMACIGVGGVVALQGLEYVARYNASEVFGWAAGISAFRDVAPLLLGFVLANAVGARNTAELLAWRAQAGEVSFRALGIHTFRIIEGPRLFALTFAALLLYPIAVVLTLVSAIVFAGMVGEQNIYASFYSVRGSPDSY